MDKYTNFDGGIQLTYGELKALAWQEAVCAHTRRKNKYRCGHSVMQCRNCPCGHAHLMYNSVNDNQRLLLDQQTNAYEYMLVRKDRREIVGVIWAVILVGITVAICVPMWRWIIA